MCNTMESATCLGHITDASGRIVMAESPTYYVAYEPVLKALQEMDPNEMAFDDELIHISDPKPPPTDTLDTEPIVCPTFFCYTPSSPSYFPTRPSYSHTSIKYTPILPGFLPSSPSYSPTSPKYTPSSTSYYPISPEHCPTLPEHCPTSPKQGKSMPKQCPTSPKHVPSSPEHCPTSPKQGSSAPKQGPTSPKHGPSSSEHCPTSPKQGSSAPQQGPTLPEQCPISPKFCLFPSKHGLPSPKHGPSLTEHSPTSPEQCPISTKHGPSSPECCPTSPEHCTSSPNQGSSAPKQGPTSPTHGPSSPEHSATSPKHGLSSPGHCSTSPNHDPTLAEHYHTSPEHCPTSPKQGPSPPKHCPSSSKHGSSLAEHSPTSPEQGPSSPKQDHSPPIQCPTTTKMCSSPELCSTSPKHCPTSVTHCSTSPDSTKDHKTSPASKLESYVIPTSMDESQKTAFEQALQNRVALIQGPPGTGKTYIGIKLVETLLEQKATKLPILVLTYKNHALDEFLEELIKTIPDGVIRVGGRSQNPIVEEKSLQKLKRVNQHYSQTYAQRCSLRNRASDLKSSVISAFRNCIHARTFSLNTALTFFTETQIEGLLQQCHPVQDKSTRRVHRISVQEVLPLWIKEKDLLLDGKVPLRKKQASSKLLSFLEAAILEWMPSKEEINSMVLLEERLLKFLGAQDPLPNDKLRKPTYNTRNQLDPDDKDAEEEENERIAAAVGSNQQYNLDVIVQKEMNQNPNFPQIIPSAEQFASKVPLDAIKRIQDLWSLTSYDRLVVAQILLWHCKVDAERELAKALVRYRQVLAKVKELNNEHAVAIMKEKRVVGMTITGASINIAMLKMLKPSVVLIEEAAEVLEPQVAAVLGSWVKHLILIGDHKQLRPQVENYSLCRNYHFDISMMERLINNGYPHATLKLQNRMRPEMAKLLLDIYPDLQSNLARVEKHNPPTFTHSMFFWNHEDPEENAQSYSNRKEAERVIQLALVIIQMGYKPCQISVLAAYQGQVRLLRRLLKKAESEHKDIFVSQNESTKQGEKDDNRIKIHTIDRFQGDENDIIIVSLVRSNKEGKIGFLSTLNRRCVAQSRARCGMYLVGNASTFLKSRGSCWDTLINRLQEANLVSQQFPLHCPKHESITQISATTAKDLPLTEICKIDCNEKMSCGIHLCPSLCRPYHSHAKCKEIVNFVLQCGHQTGRECHVPEESIMCKRPCPSRMACRRHQCPMECGSYHSHKKCQAKVKHVFDACHHSMKKKCGESTHGLFCEVEVPLQFEHCKHRRNRFCWERVEDLRCLEMCSRKLPCGHPCEGPCSKDPCDASKCRPCAWRKQKQASPERMGEEASDLEEGEWQEPDDGHANEAFGEDIDTRNSSLQDCPGKEMQFCDLRERLTNRKRSYPEKECHGANLIWSSKRHLGESSKKRKYQGSPSHTDQNPAYPMYHGERHAVQYYSDEEEPSTLTDQGHYGTSPQPSTSQSNDHVWRRERRGKTSPSRYYRY